jgi:hypothetical protein
LGAGRTSPESLRPRTSRRARPAADAVAKPRRVICSRRAVNGSVPRLTLKYQPPRLSWYTPSGLVGTEHPLRTVLVLTRFSRPPLEDKRQIRKGP